jgi:uncharacterized protein (DUF697 family)
MITIRHKPLPFLDTNQVDVIQASHVSNLEHIVEGGDFVERKAGEALSALRGVWEDEQGVVRLLDPSDEEHIGLFTGITITAGSTGETVRVQCSGVVDAESKGLVPGPVWLGVAGALVQVPPTRGVDFHLGAAVAESRLVLFPAEPIFL